MNTIAKTVEIVAGADIIKNFKILLQHGVFLDLDKSLPLKVFLLERCGISGPVLTDKIKTIFLNSRPVDDIEMADISSGDSLGLSGAMPGLVGAVFRQKSIFSSFRETITYSKDTGGKSNILEPGMVLLKVFNTAMDAVAQTLFARGVYVPAETFTGIFKTTVGFLQSGSVSMKLEGKKVKNRNILNELMSVDNELLYLVVHEDHG